MFAGDARSLRLRRDDPRCVPPFYMSRMCDPWTSTDAEAVDRLAILSRIVAKRAEIPYILDYVK